MLSLVFPIFCINVFVTFAVITLKAYLNFTRIRFESFFRGCFYEEDSGLSDEGKQKKRPEGNTKMT